MAYRRRYRRRRTGTGKRKSYGKSKFGGGEKAAQLAIMRNPFSLATACPKIPDGRASMSVGHKMQNVQEIAEALDGPLYITLYPGISSGVQWQTGSALTNGRLGYAYGHGLWAEGYTNVGATTTQGICTQVNDQIVDWRIVSQGLKLCLTNNSDQNDGWFEAVRLRVAHDPSHFYFVGSNPPTATTSNYVAPKVEANPDTSFLGSAPSTWVENATYRTGKLRDIHKTAFILKPEASKHEFQHLEQTYLIESAGVPTSNGYDKLLIDNLDQTYDIIVIRIHGLAGGAGTTATRILMHLVTNQELIYDQSSGLSRFHTKCF